MTRAIALALPLALWACAQDVVASNPADASARSDVGGAPSDAAAPARDSGAEDASNTFERDAAGSDASVASPDASARDGGSNPPSGCNRQIQDDVYVPEPTGMHAFARIQGMVFAPDRTLYVLSRRGPPYESWVTVLSPAPTHDVVRSFGHGRIVVGQDLAVDPSGNVLVIDYNPNAFEDARIHVFDPTGGFIRTFSPMHAEEGESLAFDDQGRLYVGGLIMTRYSASGTYIDAIGAWGDLTGRIGRAKGLAFDPRGFMWVADLARNRVHQFDITTRTQVDEYGGRGVGPARFDGNEDPGVRWGPTRLDLDADGNIYANDPFVSRIQKLTRRGDFRAEFSLGGTMDVGPIRVEPMNGNVYVGVRSSIAIVCPL